MKGTFIITDEEWRKQAIEAVRRVSYGHQVVIEPERRTDKQNRKLWAMMNDVAKAHIEFLGRTTWDANDWKRLLVSGFIKVKKDEEEADRFGMGGNYPPPEMRFVEGLEGEMFQIDELSTRYWPKERMAEFLSYVSAWGDQHGVEWTPYGEEPL